MKKKLPYFCWYPADFDIDENVKLMNIEQIGLYAVCLNHAWVNGSLPADPLEIARAMKVPKAQFLRAWPRVVACFHQGEDGRWRNPRQEKERTEAMTKAEKGKEAAKKRWDGDSVSIGTHDPPMPLALPRASGSDSDYDSGSVGVDHHHQKQNSKKLLLVNFSGDDGGDFASPEDELKARYLALCGEPIKLPLLDVIRSKLGGTVTSGFVKELRGHTGSFKNFPGFLRDLAGKNNRPASRAVMAEENYKCPQCGSTKRGEGMRSIDGAWVPCECADRGYIARMEARGILKNKEALAK